MSQPSDKHCQQCDVVIPRNAGNYKRKRFCGSVCMQAARKHTPAQADAAFWAKVNKTEGCWLWIASKRWDGYGRYNHHGRQMMSHRRAWEITHGGGVLPTEQQVLHICDVPACVRPDHLRLGTHDENMADMARKGRGTIGEKQPHAKLTDAQVREILASPPRLGRGGNVSEYMERYGVGRGAILSILRGDYWKHIPRPARAIAATDGSTA